MNSGKSTLLIQTAHNYEECGLKVALLKPSEDTKAKSSVSTRIGLSKEVDILVSKGVSILEKVKELCIAKKGIINCLFVEEAQFLDRKQVDELVYLSSYLDIEVKCYGLRIDFAQNGFEGSDRLLQKATIIEMDTKCKRCGNDAANNARKINGEYVKSGDQVSIDGVDSEYDSLCEKCYGEQVLGINPDKIKDDFQKQIQKAIQKKNN
jgi:thymidine kinase